MDGGIDYFLRFAKKKLNLELGRSRALWVTSEVSRFANQSEKQVELFHSVKFQILLQL